VSSRLQYLASGQRISVEILSTQISKIESIARVRKSEIIAEETLPDNKILLTLRKI